MPDKIILVDTCYYSRIKDTGEKILNHYSSFRMQEPKEIEQDSFLIFEALINGIFYEKIYF